MGTGKRIRAYRQEKKLKGKELADIINISQSALSDIENEHNKPSADTIASIVKNTDIEPYWLLTGEGVMLRTETSEKISPINSDLLKKVIKTVEDISIEKNLSLKSTNKAELIVLLFEELLEAETKRQNLRERVMRLMKLFSEL